MGQRVGTPFDKVKPFLDVCGKLKATRAKLRAYLCEQYASIIGEELPRAVDNADAFQRIAYELQIRGYLECGQDIPEKVQERYLGVLEHAKNLSCRDHHDGLRRG